MTKDILAMAQRILGDATAYIYKRQLEEFAAAIAAAERDACARICDEYVQARYAAIAIRARGEE